MISDEQLREWKRVFSTGNWDSVEAKTKAAPELLAEVERLRSERDEARADDDYSREAGKRLSVQIAHEAFAMKDRAEAAEREVERLRAIVRDLADHQPAKR